MDEKKIETTQKAIRKNAGEENAFVDLLNKETKELSDSFDSYLFYHGYRKESDTAREILDMIDGVPTNEVNELNHLRLLKNAIAKRYGVDLTEDKE